MMLPHWPIIKTPADFENVQSVSLDNMISYLDLQARKFMDTMDDFDTRQLITIIWEWDTNLPQHLLCKEMIRV